MTFPVINQLISNTVRLWGRYEKLC